MSENMFGALFNNLDLPVVVCRTDDELPVTFMNKAARLMFRPSLSIEKLKGRAEIGPLASVVRFVNDACFQTLKLELFDSGTVSALAADVYSFQDDVLPAVIHANAGMFEGDKFFFIHIRTECLSGGDGDHNRALTNILNASHRIGDVNNAIQTVLGMAGDFVKASRAYVFEDISPTRSRNTYEWCADGVRPVIQELQDLDKECYCYNAIMDSAGMAITSDVSLMPESDRKILESQDVLSLAILPIYHLDTPLGYIGFDDCLRKRNWSLDEITFLKNVSNLMASLIIHRNAEREAARSLEIVRTVTDNLDDWVYISDLDTYEVNFVSKSLARSLGKPAEEILGSRCWEILHKGQTEPCPFCMIPSLREKNNPGAETSCVWEFQNLSTGKWYLVKDSIINWLDGKPTHLGTMIDITYRKQYEEQLKRSAETDLMTDVYNRNWGYGQLERMFARPQSERSHQTLCFIDIDGLKDVNDRYGHAAGDEMIVNTIRVIFSCVRKNDLICRWGGDEFILLLNCGLWDAEKVLGKIRFGIDHFNNVSGKPYFLSISYGLVGFGEQADTVDDLIEIADKRMYESKMQKHKTG